MLPFRRMLLIGLAVALIVLAGGAVALSRIDLASTAAGYLSDRIGRKVTIASAKLHLGNPVRIELGGVSLANMVGGSQPDMITLSRLTAEVSPFLLIFGPQTVRHLSLEGAGVLLEHGPNDVPNWKLSPPTPRIAGKPEARLVLPTLLDAHFRNVEIDVRTSSGNILRTRLDDFAVTAAAVDRTARSRLRVPSASCEAPRPSGMWTSTTSRNRPASGTSTSGAVEATSPSSSTSAPSGIV